MLLENIRRRGNIGKHDPHGERLENGVAEKNGMTEKGRIVVKGSPKRRTGGRGEGTVRFTEG